MIHRMDVGRLEILLLIASVVAILARRLKLPYTVGLVLAGIGMALMRAWPNIPISKELIFSTLLPPLVFEAAFSIRWKRLRTDLGVITLMATVGVLIATAIAAVGMAKLAGWDWRAAFIFAALIAATDPVSVIAMMKESKVGGRIKLLIEAESLMNDGTGAALFVIALSTLSAGLLSPSHAIWAFTSISLGGLGVGAVIALVCIWLMGKVEDHLVEVALTTVAAWGSFLLAEYLGVSGVLATVAAGLVLGNFGPLQGMSSKGHQNAESFWEFAAFVANSFVFLVMGVKLAGQSYQHVWLEAAIAIVLVLVGRAVSVLATCLPFVWSRKAVPLKQQIILIWGGLRGALALSLALAIPDTTPNYHEVMAVTFAVVAFSVLVQGLTMAPLLKRTLTPVAAVSG